MLDRLRNKNKILLEKFTKKKDKYALKKQELIKNILTDNACFFKMTIEDAYNLFADLDILNSEMASIYDQLTSPTEFLKVKNSLNLEN